MIKRFIDTSGWAELLDRSLQFHGVAVVAFDEVCTQGGLLTTTNLVLMELTGLLTRPLRVSKRCQIQMIHDIRTDPFVEIVAIDAAFEAAAWNLWENRLDKSWSLVDCASFVVMGHRGITEALTTDHHFEQAGFVRLLK